MRSPGRRVKAVLGRTAGRALNALLPASCVLCGQPASGDGICPGCRDDLPRLDTGCPVCAEPLPSARRCGRCSSRPPPFDRIRTPLLYERPVSDLVTRFKFSGDLAAGRALGRVLARHIQACDGALPDTVVPVPLHRRRLGRRGFNQARLLAAELGDKRRLRLAAGLLVRAAATDPQPGLPAATRRGNVRGAFRVRATPPPAVALVDDVVTTASTAAECADLLRRAGSEYIEVWAVARAPRDGF